MHSTEAALHYINLTCYQWLPLFKLCNGNELVYKWFDFIKEKYSIKTTAYTIMPNHVHCILFFPDEHYIIKRLELKGISQILTRLKEGLTEKDVVKDRSTKYLKIALM
jgi:REP element-mobilizing transposase RayT